LKYKKQACEPVKTNFAAKQFDGFLLTKFTVERQYTATICTNKKAPLTILLRGALTLVTFFT